MTVLSVGVGRVARLRGSVTGALSPIRGALSSIGGAAAAVTRPAASVVRPAGWSVVIAAIGCLVIGRRAGWEELDVLAAFGLVLLGLCALFLIGGTAVDVDLRLSPQRLSVGDPPAVGDISAHNPNRRPLTPVELELQVGERAHRFRLPLLGPDSGHVETFLVPAVRRSVVAVGPARTRRGDPLGLFNRTVERTGVTEVFVRPRTLPLDALGAGLLRDLEGVSTQEISQSDLAFHALREYVAGDDLRHVHWLSSAKSDQLMVRQYLDTRRSHVTVVVDNDRSSFGSPDEFETAMSIAATIARRSFADQFDVTFVCGAQTTDGDVTRVLDAMCRAELDTSSVVDGTLRASLAAPDTSLLFVVGGAGLQLVDARRATAAFGPEVSRYALRVESDAAAAITDADGLPVLTVPSLAALPAMLRWAVR